MFDSFKQLKQLKELQSAIQKEEVSVEHDGVTITMNGTFEVSSVTLPEGMQKEKLEKAVKEAFNAGVQKAQQAIAQKFASMQK